MQYRTRQEIYDVVKTRVQTNSPIGLLSDVAREDKQFAADVAVRALRPMFFKSATALESIKAFALENGLLA